MKEILYRDAINEALREEMQRDKSIIVMGEDIKWSIWATKGLVDEFGEDRVRNTPISELGFVGAAVGAAMTGTRPVVEIMFDDLLPICSEQIVNQAARMRYMFGGQTKVPLVIRVPGGAGVSGAGHHSESLEAWFMHIPGLKVVIPSTPYDVKGLLKTAIRDDNPVIFKEHKRLYSTKGEIPEDDYSIPFGQADIKKEGKDVTIIATSYMVLEALSVAETLSKEGISVEVIDPRTLVPLDKKTIIDSVKKTGKVVIVHEACKRCGIGAEIAAIIAEEAFDYLDAPIKRVARLDVPIPFSRPLENCLLPNKEDIIKAVKELLAIR
ncbi:MAG: alpha-ketoacid dehydrogenase subunit beta [Candidatus Firestonebacteria bacterium]